MFMLPQVRCGEQMQRKPHFTPRIGPLERRGAVHIKRAYYTQFGEPFQGGGYRATAPGTKKVLFHAWMNGNWNKRQIDNSILSSNNTTSDSFFIPNLKTHEKSDTGKEEEQSQTKRKYSNTSSTTDEQPNKRRCKAEKFEAIQYSLGPNEEYIAIRSYEYDIWERNEDNLSIIYQDIFKKKDEGWKDLVKEISTNIGGEFTNLEILKC
ncbi:hypothetical protein Tco_0146389 [Tanacetum coccineum]